MLTETEGDGPMLIARDVPVGACRALRRAGAEAWPGPWSADHVTLEHVRAADGAVTVTAGDSLTALDVVAATDGAGKDVTLKSNGDIFVDYVDAGKDRGAILPAGHKGTAYMYMTETGRFASSTYYMSAHPQWVTDFNASKPADRFFKKTWAPLLPPSAQPASANAATPMTAKGAIQRRRDIPM